MTHNMKRDSIANEAIAQNKFNLKAQKCLQ